MKTSCGIFLNLAHYFPYDVKLRLLAHSRSFLANQKARNAIVGAENLLNIYIIVPDQFSVKFMSKEDFYFAFNAKMTKSMRKTDFCFVLSVFFSLYFAFIKCLGLCKYVICFWKVYFLALKLCIAFPLTLNTF